MSASSCFYLSWSFIIVWFLFKFDSWILCSETIKASRLFRGGKTLFKHVLPHKRLGPSAYEWDYSCVLCWSALRVLQIVKDCFPSKLTHPAPAAPQCFFSLETPAKIHSVLPTCSPSYPVLLPRPQHYFTPRSLWDVCTIIHYILICTNVNL